MGRYIALMRGINVSGQKKIKMADLQMLFEALGYECVSTYIQSGNVIFETQKRDRNKMKVQIEAAVKEAYDFSVLVEVLAAEDLYDIVENCPFESLDLIENGTKVLVTFLYAKPNQENIDMLLSKVVEPEELIVHGRAIYVYCPNGYGKTKLSNVFIEKTLQIDATTRNWKTVGKLVELSR